MRTLPVLGLAPVILALGLSPALAQEPSHIIRGGVQYTVVSGNSSVDIEDDTADVSIDDAVGAYLAYEWRSRMIGLEINAGYSKHDGSTDYSFDFRSKSSGTDLGSFKMYPINLAVNFHLFGRSWIDFYLGPVVGYYYLTDDLDSTWGYGVQVGADWNVSDKGLAINTLIRYQLVEADIAGVDDSIDLDPITGQVGLAYRW